MSNISPKIELLSEKVMGIIEPSFHNIEKVAYLNTRKVLEAFQKNKVDATMFTETTGYGNDDKGREAIENVYADVFHTEAALVRIQFFNGTHAIATTLYASLKPGDTLLSVTGKPYDTLQTTIGLTGDNPGTLKYYGINYAQVDFTSDGKIDYDGIKNALKDSTIKAVEIQRSRGYSTRDSLKIDEISKIIKTIKDIRNDVTVIVDNCYGEFVEELEPTDVGADLVAGSLIKNPGGGVAPTGGYVVGKKQLVDAAAMRLSVPGIGGEQGATLGQNRFILQGLFMAPHTVSQALKTAVYCAEMMTQLGYKSFPNSNEKRTDIIQTIEFGNPDSMIKFCKGIQNGAPVDSYLTPIPYEMPGYNCDVIMAAGSFIQGSSIELSADGPMREPYMVYVQGGLTFESGRYGIMRAATLMTEE